MQKTLQFSTFLWFSVLKIYAYSPLEDNAAKLILNKSIWDAFQLFVAYNSKTLS